MLRKSPSSSHGSWEGFLLDCKRKCRSTYRCTSCP